MTSVFQEDGLGDVWGKPECEWRTAGRNADQEVVLSVLFIHKV